MTVSPKRPQDGTRQPGAGGNGVELDDRSSLTSLPPTLFKLPNLDVHARLAATKSTLAVETPGMDSPSIDPAPVSAGLESAPLDAVTNLPTQELGECGEFTAEQAPGVGVPDRTGWSPSDPLTTSTNPSFTDNDDQPRIPGPPAVGSSTMTPATSSAPGRETTPIVARSNSRPIPKDAPTGRTWMESIGSHGVVIVLLLVVVAAALVTGKGEDDPNSKSLSTQSELLNFDELDVDLPMPTQDPNMTFADSQPASTRESAQQLDSFAGTPAAPVPSQAVPSPASAAAAPGLVDGATALAPSEPVVSLDPPQPISTGTPGNDFNHGLAANGIQVNKYMLPNSGTNATVASNRVGAAQRDSSLPTLEELTGLAEQATPGQPPAQRAAAQSTTSQSATSQSTASPARIVTETPAGVADWAKYLPPLDSTEEPVVGNSSYSN